MSPEAEAVVRLPPARSGQVSSAFVRRLAKYGASPTLLRKLRDVTDDRAERAPAGAGNADPDALPASWYSPTDAGFGAELDLADADQPDDGWDKADDLAAHHRPVVQPRDQGRSRRREAISTREVAVLLLAINLLVPLSSRLPYPNGAPWFLPPGPLAALVALVGVLIHPRWTFLLSAMIPTTVLVLLSSLHLREGTGTVGNVVLLICITAIIVALGADAYRSWRQRRLWARDRTQTLAGTMTAILGASVLISVPIAMRTMALLPPRWDIYDRTYVTVLLVIPFACLVTQAAWEVDERTRQIAAAAAGTYALLQLGFATGKAARGGTQFYLPDVLLFWGSFAAIFAASLIVLAASGLSVNSLHHRLPADGGDHDAEDVDADTLEELAAVTDTELADDIRAAGAEVSRRIEEWRGSPGWPYAETDHSTYTTVVAAADTLLALPADAPLEAVAAAAQSLTTQWWPPSPAPAAALREAVDALGMAAVYWPARVRAARRTTQHAVRDMGTTPAAPPKAVHRSEPPGSDSPGPH